MNGGPCGNACISTRRCHGPNATMGSQDDSSVADGSYQVTETSCSSSSSDQPQTSDASVAASDSLPGDDANDMLLFDAEQLDEVAAHCGGWDDNSSSGGPALGGHHCSYEPRSRPQHEIDGGSRHASEDKAELAHDELFDEILQDLRENKHLDDAGEQDQCSDLPSFQYSIRALSPDPLPPEVIERIQLQNGVPASDVHTSQADRIQGAQHIRGGNAQESPTNQEHITQASFDRAFAEILQDLRDKRHYDVDIEDLTRLPQLSRAQTSPTPLAPEVEAKHNAKAACDVRSSNCDKALNATVAPVVAPDSGINSSETRAIASKSPVAASKRLSDETQDEANNKCAKRKESSSPVTSERQIIGMGFFSQLQDNGQFDQVVGEVEKKKRKKAKRRRKPKADPLAGVSMGFFSGQMPTAPSVPANDRRDVSDLIQPLYNWAPVLDERVRAGMEFSLPLVLPAVAVLSSYSSFAWVYCIALPIVHTFEVLLTNFGPKASRFRFKSAPITPMMHMCCDLLLLHPMCILAVSACYIRHSLRALLDVHQLIYPLANRHLFSLYALELLGRMHTSTDPFSFSSSTSTGHLRTRTSSYGGRQRRKR